MDDQPTIVIPSDNANLPGAHWQPMIGDEAYALADRKLPPHSKQQVLDAAVSILSRGAAPDDGPKHFTGLVVGYVQSGKTLSFTTVAALARDNAYQLVIVVAGTSKPLLDQSTHRLRDDLLVEDLDGSLKWVTYTNPRDDDRRLIQQTLEDWNDPLVPTDEKRTVLVTVMKNHRHLTNLVRLLDRLDLCQVPTLIIDDEADQASLNTLVNRGRESTTYARILELRGVVPWHTFLQYTATPQAPLLINIIDVLSPEFVQVLDPGQDYVGGEVFFGGGNGLVRTIPPQDIPTHENEFSSAPPSLLDALRLFFVGVAAGLVQGRSTSNARRSMLVHPSQRTAQHQEYRRWIGLVFDEWQRILKLPAANSDRVDLIEDFESAHGDLAKTVPALPSFEKIVAMLPRAFRLTSIEEINARRGATPTVDWSRTYGWILVGGQSMDRGFTVEGLTVTYMPRGPGVGNADTIQQRARFFGYKRPYLGFCRIFLEQDALTAFEQYVSHEEEMRAQLQVVGDEGSPLRSWKRAFVLAADLQPCRNNVIQIDYARGGYANRWFFPKAVNTPQEVALENRATIDKFTQSIDLQQDTSYQSGQRAQQHLVCRDISLNSVLSDLLIPYRVSDATDTKEMTGVLLQLSKALETQKDEEAVVYQMRPAFTGTRDVDENGRIGSIRRLFQGPTRAGPRKGSYTYPGDTSFKTSDRVSVQIHFYNLRRNGKVIAQNMPVVAIWVPKRMRLDWLVQNQT